MRNPPNDDPALSDYDDNNDCDPLEHIEPLLPESEPPELHEPPGSPMPAMNTIVKTVKDLPHPQSSISYRNAPDGEWIYAEILSKAGKVKTNNWHYMNIKQNGSENGTCVSLKGAEWKREDQQLAEEIYFGTDGLRFQKICIRFEKGTCYFVLSLTNLYSIQVCCAIKYMYIVKYTCYLTNTG